MLSSEEAENARKQIIEHIEANFPEDKKEQAKKQIESMNSEQLEEFLKKNNLTKQEGCIFCSIVSKEARSYMIAESDDAIAILEINPLSKGHTLVIPKNHTGKNEIPENVFSFAKQISEKISNSLKPKEIKTATSEIQGHGAVNIIPVYNDEDLNSERYKAEESELEDVGNQISNQEKEEHVEQKGEEENNESEPEETQEEINDENTWLPRRVP